MIRTFLAPLACMAPLAGGCNVINPAEKLPSYIAIDSFTVQATPGTGSNSSRINSAFVYLDNQTVGIFDLPITFPVIVEKQSMLMVSPGVNYNGMRSYQVAYPFYLSDTITLMPGADPNVTKRYTPVTRYHPAVKFAFTQDFENYFSAPFVNLGSDTTVGVSADAPGALDGKYGLIYIDANMDSSVNITRDGFPLPPNTDLYLEMDYKSDMPMTIGLQTIVGTDLRQAYIIGLNPRTTWGKVYIDLRTFASTYQGESFKLLVRAVKLQGASGAGRAMIDNIKIVHF